jgi:FixJ family two-component response regulator
MEQVVAGRHNREIARKLDISPAHRRGTQGADCWPSCSVSSIADLVRLSMDVRKAGRG